MTTNQPLALASRYLGSFSITPSTPSTKLTDSDVATQLVAQIAAGALPPPRVAFNGPVTEYYVMFPPTYRICLGTSCSNTQFCAYHSDAAYLGAPFTYTVLPESTPTNPRRGTSRAGGGFGHRDPAGFNADATTSPNATGVIANYAWNWGDGTSSNASAPAVAHAYATPGTRLVTLIATDAGGASGTKFLSVTTQNVTVSTAGNGRVTSAPAGLVCGGTCSANFLDGATVSLTATANPGAAFVSWTGDCAG